MCVYDKIMDDFVIANLHESRNEWCGRLVSLFTPLITEGIQSIFDESWRMCVENDEVGKYLMTFQNLISRIPTWNSVIIEEERKRIIERSGCNYLEDLITCVHIIQLKVLTCIRVGNKQKKIDLSIPKLDHFIHKVYVNVARKLYMNVYLYERISQHCSGKKICANWNCLSKSASWLRFAKVFLRRILFGLTWTKVRNMRKRYL